MKNKKILILLMTVVLLLLAAKIRQMEPVPEPDMEVSRPLPVAAMLDGAREPIACWEDEAGDYVFFLPSWAEMEQVVLSPEKETQVVLNQKPLENPMNCGSLLPDVPYALSCTVGGVTTEHTLTFLKSANLPSLHLDVQSGTMEIIHETKGNQESGNMRLYSHAGDLNWSGQVESLRGRGNSSWLRSKKPYSMTLAREADLLGMGQAQEWILLANAMDPSHLRNKVAYDLAAGAGMAYAPECQWVDLYLNGEYAGVYLLSERNEIHSQRVDLPAAGSFLVSRESSWRLISQNYPHITTDSGAALRIHDSAYTEADLYRLWQSAENAILAEDGRDPVSGKDWQELIDLDSWAMEYLMGELFGNVDAGTISAYFYRDGSDPSGKICAGPVWDYDLSMGSAGAWQLEYVQAFFADKAHIWSLEDTTWFYELNRKPEFRTRVVQLYQQVFRPLMQELLETGLEGYADRIYQGALLDQRRWDNGNTQEETEYLRRYLTERLEFLDSVWLENVPYCKVLVLWDESSSSLCHAVLPGETVPTLPGYYESWEILGWYDAATEQPFDPEQPIFQDTIVYLKRLPGEEDEISPLQAVPVLVVLGILVILVLADGKRCRMQKEKEEKPIAKQKIV